MSSTRIYVGHLSHKARERDVEDFFSRYGRIREILLKNGFGFVEFDDARDAEEAVYRCNGKELRGERVIVEMTKRPPKGRDMYRSGRFPPYGGGGGGGRPNYFRSPPRRRDEYSSSQKYKLIVENLSTRVSWQDLKDMMRSAGEVIYADAHRDRKNEGIVCFSCAADLKKALDTLDGKEMNGRKIKLIDASRGRSRSRSRRSSRSSGSSRSRSRSRSPRSKSKSRSRSRSSRSSRSKSRSRSGSRSSKRSSKSRSRSRSGSARGGKSPLPRKNGGGGGGAAETNGERKPSRSPSGSRSRSRSPVGGGVVGKTRASRSRSGSAPRGKSDMED